MAEKALRVNEIFKSIQGEGIEAGRVTCFIRFVGCDFKCPFCDSKHTWLCSDNDKVLTPMELFYEVEKLGVNHVTLTGGNPALHENNMKEFILILKENGYKVSIETQGSVYKDWFYLLDCITISPKFIKHHLTEETYIDNINSIIDIANDYGIPVIIKTPIFDKDDLIKYKKFTSKLQGVFKRYLSVGNSWTNLTEEQGFTGLILDRYKKIIEWTLEDPSLKDVSVLPQIHTLVWENLQGV